MTEIPDKSWFKIGEVSRIVGVKPYVIRYWESEFREVRPSRTRSGQRLFRPGDIRLLLVIQTLLHEHRFTIDGARQHLKELADASIGWDDALTRLRSGSLVAGPDPDVAHAAPALDPDADQARIDDEAAKRIESLQAEVKRLEDRVRAATQALHAEREVLKDRAQDAEGRAAAARSDAERAEAMVRALRDEIAAGQADADASLVDERDALRATVDAVSADRDALRSALGAEAAEREGMRAQLDAALDTIRELRLARDRAESGRAALEAEARDLRARAVELHDACEAREAAARRAQARIAELEAQLGGVDEIRAEAHRVLGRWRAGQAARWRTLLGRLDD